jgi:type III secretion protein J
VHAHDLLSVMRRIVAIGTLLLVGCTREIAAGLDEGEANRGVVALAHAGVEAEKVADAQAEGKYRLVVGRDEATIAISVLANEEIPRPKQVLASQGLVPSPEAERAAHVLAISSQIERTLAAVDGVHDARVHLDIPIADPLLASLGGDAKLPKPTASVLIRHRSASAPISAEDVKKVVAGAVSQLSPEAVAVVFVPVPKAQTAGDRELAHLGPVAVTRGSLPTLRAIAIGLLVTLALLGGAVLALAVRLRRAKEANEDAAPSLATR